MYICALQSYLGNGLVIQHVHYDKITKNAIGNEYKLPEYKHKKVDGYYIDDEGQRIIIEFLGDVFHGHPSKWGEDEQERDLYGRLYKDNFTETERKFNKVISFGYIVKYVWECEYRHLKVFQSPQSILRKLRY
jgi:G:T-mismatch repair DNA endonuclease (very short patch repair protein)